MAFMKASEEEYPATWNGTANTKAEISLAFTKHRVFKNLYIEHTSRGGGES